MAADALASETELAEFGILWPLEVSRCGRAVPLGGPRQRLRAMLLWLTGLEVLRQIHLWICTRSARYNRFWSEVVTSA
jgi:hypothetical protein